MAVLAARLTALTATMERAIHGVRALDVSRQLENLAAAVQRAAAERDAAQTMAVLELSTALATTRGVRQVAERALAELRLPVPPTTASIAIVEDGHLRMLATSGADPRSVKVLERVDLSGSEWLHQVLAGEASFVDDREAFAAAHPDAGVLHLYPTGSWAAVPFRSEGTVGILSLHHRDPQPLSEHRNYFSFVAEILATALQRAASEEQRAAHFVELERTLAERDRIARTLSTTLLPPKLPAIRGFTTAAWLIPAHRDELAGDFYDLFAVGSGGFVAVLGDVCGKGAEAAAVTSLTRYAARVTTLDEPDPLRIAEVGNNALTLDPSDLFCTMAIVRYLEGEDAIDVTLAGHPQVRVLRDGKVHRVGRFGPALGLGTRPHTMEREPLFPGDSVILFSDGLIERSKHFGEDQLDEAIAAGPPGDADAIAQALRKVVLDLRSDRADDLAVLVITRTA
jgi:sigma-B regulation protein RsbU (phosphoserine phosphatase)